MFLTAYIDGEYYDLGDNIPAFNGIAELAPAESATSGIAPMRFAFGKSILPTPQLRLGKKIECVQF
jgi:hypothetical protein